MTDGRLLVSRFGERTTQPGCSRSVHRNKANIKAETYLHIPSTHLPCRFQENPDRREGLISKVALLLRGATQTHTTIPFGFSSKKPRLSSGIVIQGANLPMHLGHIPEAVRVFAGAGAAGQLSGTRTVPQAEGRRRKSYVTFVCSQIGRAHV